MERLSIRITAADDVTLFVLPCSVFVITQWYFALPNVIGGVYVDFVAPGTSLLFLYHW